MRGWGSEQVIIERIPEIITAIDSAKWRKSEKSALLRALFLNPVRTTKEPTDEMSPITKAFQELWKAEGTDHRKLVLDTLIKHGVARERLEILEAVKRAGESRLLSGNYNRIDHFGLVSQLRQSLISELQLELGRLHDPKARFLKYNEWAKSVFTTNLRPPSGLDVSNPNTIAMRSLKDDFCSLLLKEKFPPDQQIELFRVVTRTGPSKGTDLLLEDVLSRSTTNRSILEKLKIFLLEQNLTKPSLQVRVAEAVLQELREESKARNSTMARKEFMSELNSLVPEASTEKDKLLERLAYELEVPKTELQELIEDYKTTNWRKVEPLKANVASVLGEQIESMPEHLREQLIAHISRHSDQPLPRTFLDGFEQEVFRRIVANPRDGVNPYTDARMKAKAITRKLQYEVEMALADAKATEKIPALEMLLASGNMPGQELDLVQARRLSRNVLGYAANSIEEKLLLSFLETVPSHEGSTTMAYLLSQAGRERGSVAALFEVFQTVGIKFGQLASTWKIFGEEIAEETKSLKSSAEPLTKMEIEQILEKELSAAEYRKIRGVKRVLGSASLKNAALLELHDETQVVVLIQRPYASNQVYTNLDLSKKFLATVRRNGVEIPGGMMQSILGALEEQLSDELRMSKEAEHIANAQVAYQNYNTTLAKDLKGWKFEMPGVSEKFAIRDHLLFVDLAPGTTLDRLSVETKRAVGKPIVKSALNSLFERGVFNADSHSGNFLIHDESRTIAPIDVGQTEQFSKRTMWAADDRYNLAQFIRALDNRDEKRIIQYALQMQKPGSPTPSGPELRNAVHTVLKRHYVNEADRIVDVVNALAENGLVLDRKFSFGGLKGLVVLMGEEYVTPAEFRALLGEEVKKVLLKKAPVTIKDAIIGPPRTTRPNGSAAGCLLRALGKLLR